MSSLISKYTGAQYDSVRAGRVPMRSGSNHHRLGEFADSLADARASAVESALWS
jgi:hypothetical protein